MSTTNLGNEPLMFNGLFVVATEMARDVRTEFRVARCGRWNRKRKRYFVERIEINRPGCYKAGNRLYMHPTLVENLKKGDLP